MELKNNEIIRLFDKDGILRLTVRPNSVSSKTVDFFDPEGKILSWDYQTNMEKFKNFPVEIVP